MDARHLLIFDLDGARFGVDAARVRESVWMPELAPVEEAPPWVVGLFSLRGRIVPVADLRLRFGRAGRRYCPTDQVVILETDNGRIGVVVSEVCEVADLGDAGIEAPPQFDTGMPVSDLLVVGEARVGDDLVAVLDVSRLTHLPEGEMATVAEERPASSGYFCPQATAEERALFHARAVALRETAVEDDGAQLGLAVVELGGECFGVELAAVQEFCNVAHLNPIPCCPPHILGVMNLRGDLITLIDPRVALGLPSAAKGGNKVVVARLGGQPAGIAVDEVHDVVYLRKEALQAPPVALRERCGAEIMGTAPYAGKMMAVLDLPALLAREEWIVNES